MCTVFVLYSLSTETLRNHFIFFIHIMSKKLFVGNIDWGMTQDELKALFEQYGTVEEAVILTDKFTGRSRGFGFVTMTDDQEAEAAIAALNGFEANGRALVVNEARPQEPRGDRGGRF